MLELVPTLGSTHTACDHSIGRAQAAPLQYGHRYPALDAMKGIAACVIVWHHLSTYSPRSELADLFAPELLYGFAYYGLFAVQLFFVIGGFALATATRDNELTWGKALSIFSVRYIRLVAPYLVMLALLVSVSHLPWGREVQPPLIDTFSWPQLAAHLFFLQDVLGYGNLSAGTWYLCIDVQYIVLFLVIQAGLRSLGTLTQRELASPLIMSAILGPLGLCSAWYWNRVPEYDMFVFYFLSSLVLGTFLAWSWRGRLPWSICLLYCLGIAASVLIEFRPRLVVALGSGLAIYAALRFGNKIAVPKSLVGLGRISYCLFLIHYLVNAVVLHSLDSWISDSPSRAFAAMVVALLASMAAAVALHITVEAPCHRWLRSLATAAPAPAANQEVFCALQLKEC